MKIISVIPARLNSSRFPNKLLALLGEVPVIVRTYQAVLNTKLFDEVLVVTDSIEIYECIIKHQGQAMLDPRDFETGSDRIAAIADRITGDVIVNVQGDEPFIVADQLAQLIQVFKEDLTTRIDVTTLKCIIEEDADIDNPNQVKVVTNLNGEALYFSRSRIPYNRDNHNRLTKYYKHIGVYAFRREALIRFRQLKKTMNEQAESLENLRMLDHGFIIKVIETTVPTIGIDTPEDLVEAQQYLRKIGN